MHILAISSLFPTPDMPNHGIFVFNRLGAMASLPDTQMTIINPIPSSPLHKLLPRYKGQQSAPLTQIMGAGAGMTVYRPRYFALPGFNKDREHLAMAKAVMKIIQEKNLMGKIEHVDIHWAYPDLPVGRAVAKMLGIPYTITLRGMETFYLPDNDKRQELIAQSLDGVDGIISLSEEMIFQAHSMISAVKKPPTTLIRNGVDTQTFHYINKTDAREKLGLSGEDLILLGVGSLIQRKGFHHVVRSLKHLKKTFPDRQISYYILGSIGLEGDFERSLRTLIDDLNLNGNSNARAVLYGRIDNAKLPLWYSAADIFCLSSFGEGSPNVLTEALSCGCPAVAANVGSVSDIMCSEEGLGIVLPSQEKEIDMSASQHWHDAISHLIKTPHDRKRQSLSMAKYTWKWCAENARSFIQSLHEKKP
jgi:teichuronic acid biosynthesis glycosyltransferase TuaC